MLRLFFASVMCLSLLSACAPPFNYDAPKPEFQDYEDYGEITVGGLVLYENGGLANAHVAIFNQNSDLIDETNTNNCGTFVLNASEKGTYIVLAGFDQNGMTLMTMEKVDLTDDLLFIILNMEPEP